MTRGEPLSPASPLPFLLMGEEAGLHEQVPDHGEPALGVLLPGLGLGAWSLEPRQAAQHPQPLPAELAVVDRDLADRRGARGPGGPGLWPSGGIAVQGEDSASQKVRTPPGADQGR
jgi:hypothetical protein